MAYIQVKGIWHTTDEQKEAAGVKVAILDCNAVTVSGLVTDKKGSGKNCPACQKGEKALPERKDYNDQRRAALGIIK